MVRLQQLGYAGTKRRKTLIALLRKSMSFVSIKVNVFGWILLLLWVFFFFFLNNIIYQVIHCIERKYGKRIAVET